MSTPVSKHQIQALLHMSASPDGRLIPQRGGYWTVRGMESKPSRGFTGLGGTPRPAWYVTTLTVRALERRQWVERARVVAEPWQDERQLTEKGREAYKQHLLTRDNTPKESWAMTTSDKSTNDEHPYHVAKKLVQAQRESELSLKELAARFGISQGHALNLIAAYEKMTPKIHEHVFAGLPTVDEGIKAAKLSRDEQVASYELRGQTVKFYVRRTSDHDEKVPPCEGAEPTGAPPVSEQIAADPDCEIQARHTVEIKNLDALVRFAKEHGRIIVFADKCGDPLIEIYDSYRE